jgi:gliding motility-associated-like protein
VYDTVCFNGSYILPSGNTAYTSGLYQDTFAVANGCDSVISTHLFVRDSIYAVAYDTLCSNHFPVVWNGITVNGGGPNAATFISQGSQGCDSTTALNLYVQPTSNAVLNQQICIYSLPYNFLGTNLNASGTYFDTLTNAHGCDSFITLNLNVVLEYRDTVTQQICAGGSMPFYDSVYHNPGYYTHSFPSNSGCDSFKTLHLQVSPLTPPPVVVSPIAYCLNEPAQPLSATGTALLWYSSATGGSGSTIAPTPNTAVLGSQVYYVSQTLNGCEGERDSIVVWINEKPDADFIVVPNSIICSIDSVLVTFTGLQTTGSTLMWDWDGGNVSGNDPGPYKVNWNTGGTKNITLWVDNGGCVSDTVVKSVEVKASPDEPFIQLPDFVCVDDTITVYGQTDNVNAMFNWAYNGLPLSAGSSFNISWPEPGWNYFSLYLSDNGCDSRLALDSVLIVNLPSAGITYDSARICNGEIVELNAVVAEPGSTYKWSPKDYFPGDHKDEGPEVNAVVSRDGWIVLNVTDLHGCENADSIFVDPEHCCELFLPNAFSPNDDGLNDEFKPQMEERQDVKEFAIYNRYGQRVFLSHNRDEGWDGTQNGKRADLGTYYYYIRYVCTDGNTYFKKGDVILTR